MPTIQRTWSYWTILFFFLIISVSSVGNEKENKGMQQEKESLPNRRIKSNKQYISQGKKKRKF